MLKKRFNLGLEIKLTRNELLRTDWLKVGDILDIEDEELVFKDLIFKIGKKSLLTIGEIDGQVYLCRYNINKGMVNVNNLVYLKIFDKRFPDFYYHFFHNKLFEIGV